jgi:peroxiredoxin
MAGSKASVSRVSCGAEILDGGQAGQGPPAPPRRANHSPRQFLGAPRTRRLILIEYAASSVRPLSSQATIATSPTRDTEDALTTADTTQHSPGEDNALATSTDVAHLVGSELPDVPLPATAGAQPVSLRDLATAAARLVVYAYPAIGAPDRPLITPDWMNIPGAFGCTAESCAFRDLNSVINKLGAAVCGLSSQDPAEQREAAVRLSLTFPLLSDHDHAVTDHLGLPTWSAGGQRLLKRFTIIAHGPVIEHVFALVREPAAHADDVATWLRNHTRTG